MKKLLVLLALTALLAVGATAFAQDSAEDACFAHNGNLDENGKCIVEASLTVKIDYPLELQNTPLAEPVDQWIDAQRREFLSAFTEGGSPSPAPWAMDVSYTLYQGANNLTSIQLVNYSYTGGAHGGNILQTYTIDGSGNLLALTDLFQPGADVLGLLQPLAVESINQQLGADADQNWINEGTANLDAFQHFVVDGDQLIITFDQYQVGPYAIGNIVVTIPFSELGRSLAPEITG